MKPSIPQQTSDMVTNFRIEWTDSTWGPVTGCSEGARGCDNHHSERFAEIVGHPHEHGTDLQVRPERLQWPIAGKRPRMIFVNSMSDLFHRDDSQSFVDQVFEPMETANHHIYQVLTKRGPLMMDYLIRRNETSVPNHIRCGASVEDQDGFPRIRHSQQACVSIRFLSIEPSLGPISDLIHDQIDWVVVGGESGPKARPLSLDRVTRIRDQCWKYRTPFSPKQAGGRTSKAVGRPLEGVEHNIIPFYLERGESEWRSNGTRVHHHRP